MVLWALLICSFSSIILSFSLQPVYKASHFSPVFDQQVFLSFALSLPLTPPLSFIPWAVFSVPLENFRICLIVPTNFCRSSRGKSIGLLEARGDMLWWSEGNWTLEDWVCKTSNWSLNPRQIVDHDQFWICVTCLLRMRTAVYEHYITQHKQWIWSFSRPGLLSITYIFHKQTQSGQISANPTREVVCLWQFL